VRRRKGLLCFRRRQRGSNLLLVNSSLPLTSQRGIAIPNSAACVGGFSSTQDFVAARGLARQQSLICYARHTRLVRRLKNARIVAAISDGISLLKSSMSWPESFTYVRIVSGSHVSTSFKSISPVMVLARTSAVGGCGLFSTR